MCNLYARIVWPDTVDNALPLLIWQSVGSIERAATYKTNWDLPLLNAALPSAVQQATGVLEKRSAESGMKEGRFVAPIKKSIHKFVQRARALAGSAN